VILIFLAVAAAGAAVWFLVLRSQVSDRGNTTPVVGSAGSAAPTAVAASGGSGAAHTPAPAQPPPPTGAAATGAPPPPAGGSATPAGTGAAKAELVETEIAASVDGATVEITGTDQKGPAPFTAKLEKGKPYKARISARGFAATEIDIQGGAAKQTFKLVAKPRLIMVSSDPPGAQIFVDGAPTGKVTPIEIELTAAQVAKKSVRVELRKKGFRPLASTFDVTKFTDGDTQMTARFDEKLAVAPVVTRPPAGGRPPSTPPGSDTSSDTGSTDTTAPPSGGSAQGGDGSTPTPPATPPAAPPSGTGSTAGSAEPTPEFDKPK
jgi:PEGA domain-containing protein